MTDIDVLDVDIVNFDRSGIHAVKPKKQLQSRRFPTATLASEGDRHFRVHAKLETLSVTTSVVNGRILPRRVPEVDIFKLNVALDLGSFPLLAQGVVFVAADNTACYLKQPPSCIHTLFVGTEISTTLASAKATEHDGQKGNEEI